MTTATVRSARASSVRFPALVAFGGLLLREYRVLTHEPGRFLIRTVSQPFMLVFVFTFVLPTIGREPLNEGGGGQSFTDILVPGVIAITAFFKGIQVVALPLVDEFGYTREIEDRVMAPLPVWAVAISKIVVGALQGLAAMLVVFPIVAWIPAEPVQVQISWPHLIAIGLLAPVVGSAVGLALGTAFEPKQVPLMFSVVILPITFLGATYFPWAELDALPWLQAVTLLNPLVYMAEGFRMALTPQFEHMPALGIYAALAGFTVALTAYGIHGFRRRVIG
jgi:ABC-2 type transport system permease protein